MNEQYLRFGINTESKEIDIDDILKELPGAFVDDIVRNKAVGWPEKRPMSWISYKYTFCELNDIKEATEYFLNIWVPFSKNLQKLKFQNFELHITFEITVTDWSFPAIVFEKEFIDFTSEHNISFGMYFWSGDAKYNEE